MDFKKLSQRYEPGFYLWFMNRYFLVIAHLCNEYDVDEKNVYEWLMKKMYTKEAEGVKLLAYRSASGYPLTEIECLIVKAFEQQFLHDRNKGGSVSLAVMNFFDAMNRVLFDACFHVVLFELVEDQLFNNFWNMRKKRGNGFQYFDVPIKERKYNVLKYFASFTSLIFSRNECIYDAYFFRMQYFYRAYKSGGVEYLQDGAIS